MRTRLALLLAAVLALTACGDSAKPADGPASLRMTIWTGNADHLALFTSIADEYRKANPNVTEIKFDTLPIETYTTGLTTQIAGGNAPDLAWILENSAPDFVSSGALVPLKVEDAGDLVPSATRLWQTGGKLYAYPFSTSPFGVFVNNDLVKQAGQQTPAELIAVNQWTWDRAFAVNAAVNAGTGKGGLVVRDFDYKTWDNLSTVWGGWGASPWSEDGKKCGFTDQPMVDAMTAFHRAIFTDRAVPGPGTAPDFFAGNAAMTVTQISRASLLKDSKFGWDLVPLPAGPSGTYGVIGQAGIGVLKKGKNADVAAKFLEFFTNPENSAKLARYFPPPRKTQLTAENLAKTNPLLKPEQLQKVVIDGINVGKVKPSHTGQAEISQTVRAALDPLWKADADVKAVLGGVCSKIQPMLSK